MLQLFTTMHPSPWSPYLPPGLWIQSTVSYCAERKSFVGTCQHLIRQKQVDVMDSQTEMLKRTAPSIVPAVTSWVHFGLEEAGGFNWD